MLWLLAATLLMQAQDEVRVSSHPYVPESPYTLRIDAKVVEMSAVVRDGHGKLVPGLTKDAFTVLDNGKPRAISSFEVAHRASSSENPPAASPAPVERRFLALFFDDVNGQDEGFINTLKNARTGAQKFVQEAPSNLFIGIFTASGENTLDFTGDQAKISEAIGAIKSHLRLREGGLVKCPRITPYLSVMIAQDQNRDAIQAVIYDSGANGKSCGSVNATTVMAQAQQTFEELRGISRDTLNSVGRVVDRLAIMPGPRELVIASSGFMDPSLDQQKDQVINHALRTGVVISALDSKGVYNESAPGSRPTDALNYRTDTAAQNAAFNRWSSFESTTFVSRLHALNETMAALADGTGGALYQNNVDLAAGFRELAETPEFSYRLSFQPDDVTPDGKFHKLKVNLAHGKDRYSVQARPGYFAPSKDTADLQARIDQEIQADDTVAAFPVSIGAQKGEGTIAITVGVDISKLRFTTQGDRKVQQIAFTTALFDAQGKMTAAKEGIMDLNLTEATYQRLLTTGIKAVITLPATPGTYRLRQVTGERVDGKIVCSSHSIEIK